MVTNKQANTELTVGVIDQIIAIAYDPIEERPAISAAEIEEGGDGPKKNPEIEPEKLPKENPGEPDEEPDEDDDDDNPFEEPEIGDDPDRERTKLPIMH